MICENCGMLTKPFNDGSCEFCGQSVTKPSNNLKNFQPHDNRGDSSGVESDRAKEVEAIVNQRIFIGMPSDAVTLRRYRKRLREDIEQLIKRAEVEAFEKLDDYMYSDQGVTDIELVQEYVTERLKELRGSNR